MGVRRQIDWDGGTGTLYIRNVSNSLRDAFKGYCYKRGKSMRKMLIKMMREALQNEEKIVLTARQKVYYRDTLKKMKGLE